MIFRDILILYSVRGRLFSSLRNTGTHLGRHRSTAVLLQGGVLSLVKSCVNLKCLWLREKGEKNEAVSGASVCAGVSHTEPLLCCSWGNTTLKNNTNTCAWIHLPSSGALHSLLYNLKIGRRRWAFFFPPSTSVAVLREVQTALAAKTKETAKLSLGTGLLRAQTGWGKQMRAFPFLSLPLSSFPFLSLLFSLSRGFCFRHDSELKSFPREGQLPGWCPNVFWLSDVACQKVWSLPSQINRISMCLFLSLEEFWGWKMS